MPAIIPFIPLIAAGVSAAGGYLANKGTQTSSQAPAFDPASQGLRGQVASILSGRLADGSLPTGYETTGIQGINRAYDSADARSTADLTARGLASSPIASAVAGRSNVARAGEIGGLRTQLPLIARQLQNQDISSADAFANAGRGTTGTGTTASGGGPAGAFTNLAQMLGYLTAKGSFRGQGLYPVGAGAAQPSDTAGWG